MHRVLHEHVKRVRVHHISLGLLVIGVITFLISFSAEPRRGEAWMTNNGASWRSTSYLLTPSAWTNTGSVLPGNLGGSQVVLVNNTLLLLGGWNSTATNVIYSAPTSNPTSWTNTGATLPGGLAYSQVAVIDNYIYLFGGVNSWGNNTNVIYRAPTSNPTSWTNTGAILPANLASSQLGIIGSYVYLFGGLTTGDAPTNVIYRAPTSNPTAWTNTGATLPGNLSNSHIAVIGSYVYLFGGSSASGGWPATNVIYRAPTSNPTSWETNLDILPWNLSHGQLLVAGDYIYIFGGGGGTSGVKYINGIYRAPILSPTSWVDTGSTLPGPLGYSQSVIVNDYAYLLGGRASGPATNVIYRAPLTPTATVPDAPTSLDAVAGVGKISLSWVTPSNNGGSAITGYKIYRDTSAGATTLRSTVGVVTTFDDLTAATGTTYYYRVRATNAIGDSPYSNEDSAMIPTPPPPVQCTTSAGTRITGYAWSDTVGWIDFNCQNSNTCATTNFGLAIANDGSISGCAWSENVGWVSASAADLTSCPSGTCSARMDELALKGWMKVLNSSDAQSGAWDGFISLSGTSPTYGPTLASSTLSGYAWGDTTVGWVSFNPGTSYTPVQTTWLPTCALQYSCVSPTSRQNACTNAPIEACSAGLICLSGACTTPPAPSTSPGNELTVTPRLVRTGGTVLASWNVADATSCTVTEDSPSINDTWTATSSAITSCTHVGNSCRTSPITGTVTYTLNCTGPGGNLTQTAKVYSNPSWKEL